MARDKTFKKDTIKKVNPNRQVHIKRFNLLKTMKIEAIKRLGFVHRQFYLNDDRAHICPKYMMHHPMQQYNKISFLNYRI